MSNLTATGGSGGANNGSGIYVTGPGEINHLTISGVTVTGNTGFGIAFNNTSKTSDVEILNSTVTANTDTGIRIASATPEFTGLLIDGCTVSNNGTFGFASNPSQTNANINTGFVFQNSSFTGNNTAGGANNHVMFFGAFSGTATISNVDITANTRAHGIVFNGSGDGADLATWPAAGAIVMNDVVFGGTIDKTCTYFYRYSTLANVSMTDVDMSAVTTLPNWHQLSADTNGVLDAGNTKLTTISSGGCAIDARDVTFYGSGGAIDKTVLANLYRIEDAIRHQVDTGVPGLVRVNDASVYVSVNSGTIENAVAAASADDVIYVEAGVPVVLTQEITKSVSFAGDFVILSTSFPDDATGQTILESFLSRGAAGQSTFSAVTTGMTADQLNAIGSLSTYFNGGVTGDLTLTSAQSAAQITSLLAGAADGAVYAVATGMGDDQLNAVAANAVKIAADGISGTMIVTSAIVDANLGALLGKASVADAIVEINASGMTDGELSTVVLAGDRVDEAYNLALDNGQTDSEITALLAKSVAPASTGKAMAVADATDMDAAKLNALGASYAKLAGDGITGSVLVTGGSLGVTDANLTNLFLKIADTADVRIDGTDMGASTLTILSSNISLVDSAFDLAFTSAQSVTELSNLLGVSDVASATADATGMDSAAGGQLATLADNYTKFVDNGITGTVSITAGLTFQQITDLLSKVDLTGATFVAGTTVLIDAAGMSDAQLTSVVDAVTTAGTPENQAAVFDVVNLTLTQNQSSEQMAALLNVTLDNEATVDATGMDSTQLAELGNYSDSVETITGSVTITADLSAAQIAAIMGNTSTEADVTIDSNGMSPEQQAAVFSTAIVSVEANATVATGETFFVDVDISGLSRSAVGLQARVAYDPAFIEYVADFDGDTFTDSVGGDDFPQTVYVTEGAGFVTFATGVDIGGDGTGITSGNAARLRFRAIAPYCNQTGLVWLATTGFANQATDANATAIPTVGTNFSNVTSLNNLQLAGVPASDIAVPADAGTVLGAVIAQPTVTASNNCTSVPVTFSITYPDLTTGSTWPTYFPVGVSTIEWTTTDAGGNVDSAIRLYTVENYQLATIDVNLVGGVNPSLQFNQDVRIRLSSGDVVTATVAFTGNNGAVTDVQIPVRDDYTCITAKDAAHTLANARTLSVSGTKWVTDTTFELIAGDSNDDNVVDILDFGVFVSDRGAGKNPASRSNFNRDAFVNNADFAFIGLNFLDIGDSCGAFNGGQPLDRISVKDLRRMGLGHLEEADINMDGWVDATDIALAMQGQYRKDYAERLHPTLEVDMPQW
ncbi:MAG: beta strand repeat-containing protein [Phycisphaerales bacterium]